MIKHPPTTYFYQFLAEGILIFLILYPFTYDYYSFSHYAGYLFVLIFVGGCFYLGEQSYLSSISYGLPLVFGAGFLYIFNFPVGLVFFFPLLFLLRYTSIRGYKRFDYDALYLHNVFTRYERNVNKIYLHSSLVLSLLVFFLTKQVAPFFFLFIQILILITGFLVSHTRALGRDDRRQLKARNLYILPFGLLMTSSIFFIYFQGFHVFFRSVWQMILYSLVNISATASYLVALFFPNIDGHKMTAEERKQWIAGFEEARKNMLNFTSNDETDFTIFLLLLGGLLIIFILLFIARAIKRGSYRRRVKAEDQIVYLENELREVKNESRSPHIFSWFRRKKHPVREILFDFEKWTEAEGFGRYPHESLADWFGRLKLELDPTTYEKVRYGNKAVREEEVEALKQDLTRIKEELKGQG